MIFFFFFFFFGKSVWWKFQSRHWHDKVKNSFKTPILLLVYQKSCPHCHGLPEKHFSYSETNPNRTDVIFSAVNCDAELTICRELPVNAYPAYLLIFGEKPRYWPYINDREPQAWERYIKKYTSVNLKEIRTDEEFVSEIFNSINGGTVFYAEVPSKEDQLLKMLGNEVRKFAVYNDSFIYRVNQNIEKSSFTAFRSPVCSVNYTGPMFKSEIFAFIDDLKFGHMHKFDAYEFFEESSSRRTLIDFEYGNISPERKDTLLKYSSLFCENTSIGWAPYKQAALAVRALKLNTTEMPILVAANRETDCVASFDLSNVAAARAALSSQLCMPRFKRVWGTALIRMKLKGYDICLFLTAAGLISVLIIRLYESYVSKDE